MSDVMLHGILRMPPELWRDDPMQISQRHSRYIQASDRIEADAREIERLRSLMAEAVRDFHGKSVLFSSDFLDAAGSDK